MGWEQKVTLANKVIYDPTMDINKITIYHLPSTDDGTANVTAACILTLKLEESRNSSRRILNTDGALQK